LMPPESVEKRTLKERNPETKNKAVKKKTRGGGHAWDTKKLNGSECQLLHLVGYGFWQKIDIEGGPHPIADGTQRGGREEHHLKQEKYRKRAINETAKRCSQSKRTRR